MIEKEKVPEFKINEYLTLKLEEDGKTIIYIAGTRFRDCKYLLINIPVEKISSLDELESIDEAAAKLDHSLEPRREIKYFIYNIPPETEFWGHCSNLQVWYESGYNTKLLHANLAFPLLRQLARAGDQQAKKVFKEEIAERYNNGIDSVREYLRSMKFVQNLSIEEFLSLITNVNDREVIEQLRELYPRFERRERGGLMLKLNLDMKKGRVVKIDLSGLELNQIPEQIRNLTSLEDLNVSFNLLEGLPEWIGEFTALKVLRITDNQLKTLPNSIGGLTSFEGLYARGNQLETLPETVGKLKSLKVLELYQNNLTTIPEAIGNLTNLELLDLHENQLTTLPNSIGDLKNLKKLRLHKNQLKNITESIGGLQNLKTLNLGNNLLGYLPLSIGNLTELELLAVSRNPLYDIPDSLYELPNLKELWVTETQLDKYQVEKKKFKNKLVSIYYSFYQKREG